MNNKSMQPDQGRMTYLRDELEKAAIEYGVLVEAIAENGHVGEILLSGYEQASRRLEEIVTLANQAMLMIHNAKKKIL